MRRRVAATASRGLSTLSPRSGRAAAASSQREHGPRAGSVFWVSESIHACRTRTTRACCTDGLHRLPILRIKPRCTKSRLSPASRRASSGPRAGGSTNAARDSEAERRYEMPRIGESTRCRDASRSEGGGTGTGALSCRTWAEPRWRGRYGKGREPPLSPLLQSPGGGRPSDIDGGNQCASGKAGQSRDSACNHQPLAECSGRAYWWLIAMDSPHISSQRSTLQRRSLPGSKRRRAPKSRDRRRSDVWAAAPLRAQKYARNNIIIVI